MKFEFRPNSRIVNQIALLERRCGRWDNFLESGPLDSSSLLAGCRAAFMMDTSSPSELSIYFGKSTSTVFRINEKPDVFTRYVNAHAEVLHFDRLTVESLYDTIEASDTNQTRYRNSATYFLAPSFGEGENEIVFPTVSSFLLEHRLEELVNWTKRELALMRFHPLVVIAGFHLLFLQIHPFRTANHRLAFLLSWQLLFQHGFRFVANTHFAPQIVNRREEYFKSLRQAEKTAYGNWSTLNVWLEFFLDILLETSKNVIDTLEQKNSENFALSKTQRRILETVRSRGTITKEQIVSETGITSSSVKYNLGILTSKGQLKRLGNGKATSYSLCI